jgi:hypothetical protein
MVIIDMNSHDIAEYYGSYDHDSVNTLLSNMEEALEFIEDQIDTSADWVQCKLVWERGDDDGCNTTYLEFEYVGTYTYAGDYEI